MIVVAVWPLLLKLQVRLGGKRWAAVTVLTAALLLAFVVPLSLAVTMVLAQSEHVGEWAQSLHDIKVPPPPTWVENVPVVGSRISGAWRDAIAGGPEAMSQKLAPYAKLAGAWLIAQIGSAGMLMLQFL